MGTYVLVNDIHAADKPPSSCTEAYHEDLWSLLAQVHEVAAFWEAAGIVVAGDVFHHKAPSRTSHRLVIRMQLWVQQAPCPVYIVPGNHDLMHDQLGSLSSQPLGVLAASGARMLSGWYEAPRNEDDPPLYGVPWLQGYGDYGDGSSEQVDYLVGHALTGYLELEARYGAGAHGLVVAHAPLYPPGQELPHEYFPAERWAEAMGGRGQCWYGHVHERHGIFEAGGVTFANFGALSRGSLHEYNLTRQVAIGLWDSFTGQFTEFPMDAIPASQLFRSREQARPEEQSARLQDFLAGISGTSLEVMSTESVIEEVRALGLGEAECALAEELLREQA